jgi:hAT family C-terminal dimerisation region
MVRDYLAIPATGAPAERVFSGGADLAQPKRGSLSEDSVRECVHVSEGLAEAGALIAVSPWSVYRLLVAWWLHRSMDARP